MIKKAKLHRIIRKWHRYLGVSLGIQFLAWTLGGLYFSWTNIDEIRGDNLRKENPPLAFKDDLVGIAQVVSQLQKAGKVDDFVSVQLVTILGKTYYQIIYHTNKKRKIQLVNAQTGALREALSEQEAVEVAENCLKQKASIKQITYLTATPTGASFQTRTYHQESFQTR